MKQLLGQQYTKIQLPWKHYLENFDLQVDNYQFTTLQIYPKMELLLECQISINMQNLGEKLKNLFWQFIFWYSIAEKFFWSDILQENLWQISMFD